MGMRKGSKMDFMKYVGRSSLINTILDSINGETYLEIGVAYGHTFVPVRAKRKIAVDPQFKCLPVTAALCFFFGGERTYFDVTSDEFFEHHTSIFEQDGVDVSFVDGLHTYEQSLRDVCNCLRHLNEGGLILLHDCNPMTQAMAHPASNKREASRLRLPGWTGEWCGDVWKTIVNLRSTKQGLEVFVLEGDYGVGVIKKRAGQAHPLSCSEEEIGTMNYRDLESNRGLFLNLKDPSYLQSLLRN